MEDLISKENCIKILKNHYKSTDFILLKFEVLPFDIPFAGLIGSHYILRLEYERNAEECVKTFFVKTLSTNSVMSELSNSVNVYEKEEFFYTHLRPEYDRIKLDTSYIPKSYLFFPHVVVLENLVVSGFKGTDKKQPLDLDHCKICLDILAKFHTSSIIYEKNKSKELSSGFNLLQENKEILENQMLNPENLNSSRYIASSIKGLFALIDEVIPEEAQKCQDALQRYLDELFTNQDDSSIYPSAVLHGDLWSSNFLYLYENGRPVKGVLLDYQFVTYGLPQSDLLQFIMTSTRKTFREENYLKLLDFYYEKSNDILRDSGCEDVIQPKDVFLQICEGCKTAAKLFAIVDRCITFVSDESYVEAFKSEEVFRKFLFDERSEYIISSYRNNKEFRELMNEDVLELKNLLFA